MFEVIFLIILATIAIIFAVAQDLKQREVANWLSLSLVIFALGFRFFWSLFEANNFSFFYQGLIGLGIFFLIGNFFYYGRLFAGGDAKLMMALGATIPLSNSISENLNIFILFFILFLVSGAFYGLFSTFFFAINNKKKFTKEFKNQFKKNKKLTYSLISLGIIFAILSFTDLVLLYLGLVIFISPYLYLLAKSVDESCMIKKVSPEKLTEGDWLYQDVQTDKDKIKANWNGLSKEEIELIKLSKKDVLIRYGIPYTPVFLISFLGLIYILF
jgi:Flp pilus assembly protein protease CpaA